MTQLFIVLLMFFSVASAHASRGGMSPMTEEYFMVSNGQGVSSPSFWNGLEGENPAGLIFNQSMKLQLGAGSYSSSFIGDSTSNSGALGSAGFLLGNGLIAGGVGFDEFMDSGAAKTGKISAGLAGRIAPIMTTLGVTVHKVLKGSLSYDAGMIIEPSRALRIGFTVPDLSGATRVIAGGVTYMLDDAVAMVVDADYNTSQKIGVVKPGVTFQTAMLQSTVAYGIRYKGSADSYLYHGFSSGIGFKLAQSLLLTYEYRGIPEHRVGLTLRFN